MEVRQVFL